MTGTLELLALLVAADTSFVPGSDAARGDAATPAPAFASVVVDTRRDRLILFGGWDGMRVLDELWARPLSDSAARWSRLPAAGDPPGARARHAAVYDPDGDRMLVHGGLDGRGVAADVWSLSLRDTVRWERLEPRGDGPGARHAHAMVLDRARSRALVLGGGHESVWALDLGERPRPAWSRLEAVGGGPGVRFGHSAVLDSAGDRVLCFGGYGGNYSALLSWPGGAPTRTHDDLWVLEFGAPARWSPVQPVRGIAPQHRGDHAAALDPAGRRMLVLGGTTRYAGNRQDLWSFSMDGEPRWQLAHAQPSPAVRPGARMVADPARDRLLVIAGEGAAGDGFQALPLSTMRFTTPSPPVSGTKLLLVAEGVLAGLSCIGFAQDGAVALAGFNGLCGLLALGGTALDPNPSTTLESQFALGATWLGLAAFQAGQHDRGVPRHQVVIGNLAGYHAMIAISGAVDWIARRLHGEGRARSAAGGPAGPPEIP